MGGIRNMDETKDVSRSSVYWPDLTFPPVNLYIVMSAEDFYKLKEQYGLPSYRLRDIYFPEGECLQQTELVMFSWDKDF